MAKTTHTTILCALAIVAALSHAHAADTLADMDIEVSPELLAQGIDPGVKHMAINGRWQAVNPVGAVMMLALLGQATQPGPVVILGDSIMADLGALPNTVNLAVSGTTTGEILASTTKIPANASLVVIEGGVNNFKVGEDGKIVPDYRQIIATVEARAPHARLEVLGILPVNDAQIAPIRKVDNAKIAAVDAQIAALCLARCTVLPSPFGKSLSPTLNRGDGEHPNAAGLAAIARTLH